MEQSKFKVGDRVYFSTTSIDYEKGNIKAMSANGLQGVIKSSLQTALTICPLGTMSVRDIHLVEWANGSITAEPPSALRLIKPDQDEDQEINQQTLDILNKIKDLIPA